MQPPMSAEVKWNQDEKIIGVVGVAPAATADFYNKIIQLTPVRKDWEHVQVIIDSNPKIPSRGRHLELNETDPVPFIRDSMKKLHHMGASIIAVPCNTAHILYERYAIDLPMVVPNMIRVTVEAAINTIGKVPRSAAVFASRMTQQHRLYEKMLQECGGDILDTAAHQTEVSALIEEVKQGKPLGALQTRFQKTLSAYPQADVIILGCTELSLLAHGAFENIPIIDSNIALAQACLSLSGNDAFCRGKLAGEG